MSFVRIILQDDRVLREKSSMVIDEDERRERSGRAVRKETRCEDSRENVLL